MPVAAPASVIPDASNEYYKSDEGWPAIGEAMRTEYRMIVDAGFLLQLDDARTAATYDRMVPPAQLRATTANGSRCIWRCSITRSKACRQDRIRYHVCWGSWPDRTPPTSR